MPYRRSFAMYPQSPAMFIRNVDSLFVRHHSHSFIFVFVLNSLFDSPHFTLRHIQIHLFSYTDQSNVHRWIWRASGPACIWMTFWRACVWMSVRCACLWMRTNELACAHMYVIWGHSHPCCIIHIHLSSCNLIPWLCAGDSEDDYDEEEQDLDEDLDELWGRMRKHTYTLKSMHTHSFSCVVGAH